MTVTAILLGHDDQVIGEWALPMTRQYIDVAVCQPQWAKMTGTEDELCMPSILVHRYALDEYETELYRIIDERGRIYRRVP